MPRLALDDPEESRAPNPALRARFDALARIFSRSSRAPSAPPAWRGTPCRWMTRNSTVPC